MTLEVGSRIAHYNVTAKIGEGGMGEVCRARELGDTFGLRNAYASGLALFGVVVAIVLQQGELELQRQEIAQNREELARSATAQEESQRALVKAMQAQAFKAARDIRQDQSVRNARRHVMSRIRGSHSGLRGEFRSRCCRDRLPHVRHGWANGDMRWFLPRTSSTAGGIRFAYPGVAVRHLTRHCLCSRLRFIDRR